MTSFRDCGICGGSGRHSFERCFECKGLGMIEDEPEELVFSVPGCGSYPECGCDPDHPECSQWGFDKP